MGRGRPKGSKNKSTLEREAKGRFSLSDSKAATKTTPNKTTTKKVSSPNTKVEVENETPTPPAKVYNIPPCSNSDNLPEGYEFLSKAQYDKLTQCGKCKAKVLGEPFRIDTNLIAGLCQYHREHPRYIRLCRSCAKQLSDMIDEWLGVEYLDKWQPEMREDR